MKLHRTIIIPEILIFSEIMISANACLKQMATELVPDNSWTCMYIIRKEMCMTVIRSEKEGSGIGSFVVSVHK